MVTMLSFLTPSERIALGSLGSNPNIASKTVVQGGVVVVWWADLYHAETRCQLLDISSYLQLDHDPTVKHLSQNVSDLIAIGDLFSLQLYHFPSLYFPLLSPSQDPETGLPCQTHHLCLLLPTELISTKLDSILFPLVSSSNRDPINFPLLIFPLVPLAELVFPLPISLLTPFKFLV